MRPVAAHILAFGRLLALLFLVANSGFTVVLSYCTMCDTDAGVMECCSAPVPCSSGSCGTSEAQGTAGATIVAGVDGPCLVTMVAGGTPAAPTISEREATHRQDPSVAPLPDLHLTRFAAPARERAPLLFPRGTAASPPQRVEKYVLHESFRM